MQIDQVTSFSHAPVLKASAQYHWQKLSSKCQNGIFDCSVLVREGHLQPRTWQNRHGHTKYPHVYLYLPGKKTVGKRCPSAYNHCVLRRNNFGFSKKRLQINSNSRASGYILPPRDKGWLILLLTPADTSSGHAGQPWR